MYYLNVFLIVGLGIYSASSHGAAPTCADVSAAVEQCEGSITNYPSEIAQYQTIRDLRLRRVPANSASANFNEMRRNIENSYQQDLISLNNDYRSGDLGIVVLRDEWFKKEGAESLRYCRGNDNALGKFEDCKRRLSQLLIPSDAQPSNSPSINSGAAPQ